MAKYMFSFTGKLMNETMGKIHFWVFLAGLNITFFPQHFLGNNGMPRRIYTYPADAQWDLYNVLGPGGALLMGASTLVFVYNMIVSWRSGEDAGRDPWDACTLEWLTESPPKIQNFDFTPIVLSERPVWDHKYTEGMEIIAPEKGEHFHMPSYSWKPMICSGFVVSIVIGLLLSRLGVVVLAGALADRFHYDVAQLAPVAGEWVLVAAALGVGILAAALPARSALALDISNTLGQGR